MIKVFTMNINAYYDRFGPWSARLGMIREMIQDACPDILAFQAVAQSPDRFGGESQAGQIARLFPVYPHLHYQPSATLADGLVEGIAILSRFPIQDVKSKKLSLMPGIEDNNQRVLLHASFNLAKGPLHLFNAHFSWVKAQAEKNIKEALRFMRSFSGPALLVGDLNQPPESPVFNSFNKARWTDAWGDIYPSEDGFTFFEGTGLVKRIDYAWINSELKPHLDGVRLISSVISGLDSRASDHDALMASFSIKPGQPQPC